MLKTSGETGTFGGLVYVILWWRMLKHLRIGVGVEWQMYTKVRVMHTDMWLISRSVGLLEHATQVVETVVDGWMRKIVIIDNMQFGYMAGRSRTDAIFIVCQRHGNT